MKSLCELVPPFSPRLHHLLCDPMFLNYFPVHPSLPLLTSMALGILLPLLESSFSLCSQGELPLFFQIQSKCPLLCKAATTLLRSTEPPFFVRAHIFIRVSITLCCNHLFSHLFIPQVSSLRQGWGSWLFILYPQLIA